MGTLNSSTLGVANLKPTTSTLTGNVLPASTTTGVTTTVAGLWMIDDGVVNTKKMGTSMGMSVTTTTTAIGINCQPGIDAEYIPQETQIVSYADDNISEGYLETATYQYESHPQVAELTNDLYSVKDGYLEQGTEIASRKDSGKKGSNVQSPIESIGQDLQEALSHSGMGLEEINRANEYRYLEAYFSLLSQAEKETLNAAINAKEAELQAGTPKKMVKRLQTSSKHL